MLKINLWMNLAILLATTACSKSRGLELGRENIAQTAEGHHGSKAWAYDSKKGNFPANSWKCNLFVYDVLREAKVTAPVWSKRSIIDGKNQEDDDRPILWPIQAEDWTFSTVTIPDWEHKGNSGNFERGDVIGQRNESGSPSTHCGIAVSRNMVISAGYDRVTRDLWPNYSIRRYTGF